MYYRLRALHNWGLDVVLHVFQYRRPRQPLPECCSAVHYYRRPLYRDLLSLRQPYIVASRRDPGLLPRLLEDKAPILFEGLHTTALLAHPALADRTKVVRMHNIEHRYYAGLASQESHLFRQAFFRVEAERLLRWEPILAHAQGIAAITPADRDELAGRYGSKAFFLPAAHADEEVSGRPGKGSFALCHGNLAVAENHAAACYLLKDIAIQDTYPLVIAGKQPRRELRRLVASLPNVRLVADPDHLEMQALLQEAQMVLLPGFQSTGLKLKLVASLYQGRHVIASPAIVMGTGMEPLCSVAASAGEWRALVEACRDQPYTEDNIRQRAERLRPLLDTRNHSRHLLDWLGIRLP